LNSNSIAGYSISSSKLTSISSSSYSVSGASAVAMAPSGNFLYVASTGSGITPYTIASSGALTSGTAIDGDTVAQSIQVDPSGRWLLDASAAGTLRAIPITTSGTLDSSRSVQSQSLAGTAVQQMAISPNGSLIAVALGSTGTQLFGFTSGNASPLGSGSTPIKVTNASAGSAISVAVDPQNRLLYIGEVAAFPSSSSNSGALRVFTISGNTLTEFTYASPYPSGGLAPHFILPIATGKYVYVANGAGNSAAGNITGFAVTTTALTTGSTVTAGVQPLSMAEDSTGSWVFEVGSTGSPYFDAYTFDSTTAGQLDSQVTSTSAATSIAIVATP
jgi:6-phosphogluconolactonase (cycloisomerase 2 family)